MLFLLYLAPYLVCGVLSLGWLLPEERTLYRLWLGCALGLFCAMWLPALWAFALGFTVAAHLAALGLLALLTALAFLSRVRGRRSRAFGAEDGRQARILLSTALPLTALAVFLQYTHNLLPSGGALYVGQSTYGDLALHTGIITSLEGAKFPADYSILPGARLSYPFLADSLSATGLVMGLSLQAALNIPSALMLALVFSGYALLALRLAGSRRAAALSVLLLFLNGGLGFLYAFDMLGESLGRAGEHEMQMGVWLERLSGMMSGWYQTPVNHAEFDTYNLRWSNIIADMLTPQRTFLAGWALLFPCLYLLWTGLEEEALDRRRFILLGLLAGGLPLIHTHSFLALGLVSAGWLARSLLLRRSVGRFFLYGGIAVLLALPQLIFFTFPQSGGEGFLRFHFNWVNNPGGQGLRDGYLWFYVKNIGLPFLLLIFSLFEKNGRHRFLYSGAFAVFIAAELIVFQPNEYDNNKLFYVWYALCVPAVSDYALGLYDRLKGLRARPLMAALACLALFLSGSLSLAREAVSRYQAYSPTQTALADFAREETEPGSLFIAWPEQHLNPVSALAGRRLVCGPMLWLHWHGFDLSERQADIASFYKDPRLNASVLSKYAVDYILLGPDERNAYQPDEALFDSLFDRVYEDAQEAYTVYRVPLS